MHILFPGRHHLLTDFQFKYLYQLLQSGLAEEKDVDGQPLGILQSITDIVFAVTSANHSNTRRNPMPFYLRAVAIEDFVSDFHVPVYIYGIEDVGVVKNFAEYTIKKIKHDSEGKHEFTPDNTVVICSTPVMEYYRSLGFKILPAELEEPKEWKFSTEQPWDIVEMIADCKDDWKKDKTILHKMHPASYNVWKKYNIAEKVQMLYRDKIIGDDGDITATRDYNSYVRQMDDIAEMKYNDTSAFIKPGRIGDIGCAVGSWIKLACRDERFRESDFFGIEVARHLYEVCQQRKANGEFANQFVFFAQKNAVTGLVYEPNSMNTIFTSSLTHEIESYGGREDLLNFIKNRFNELTIGGVWINRDVVGPEDKDSIVYMKLNQANGRNNDYEREIADRMELSAYLEGLSTFGRFLRFVRDFRKKQGYQLNYELQRHNEMDLIVLKLKDAAEFLTKKDYLDNWQSEMYETFCYWSFSEWKSEMEKAGFKILSSSVAFVNDWMVKNRFENEAELFEEQGNSLVRKEYPVTNMFMIAERTS